MGKSLNELMGWHGPMTHRQFLTWQAWTEMEWNRPSRSDFYAMQTAARAAGVTRLMWKNFFIPFDEREDKKPTTTREEAAEASKLRWAARRAAARRNERVGG